jgi:predicted LPLAT superfamily acyltransferase
MSKPTNKGTKDQHWSTIEERGSIFGMRILFAFYRLVGRRILWLALFPVVFYLYLVNKVARNASLQFLAKAIHDGNGEQIKVGFWHGLKHHCSFADSVFDKLDAWLGKINKNNIDYLDRNGIKELVEQKQGGIFIGSHLGNLEVCRALSTMKDNAVINVLVFTENAVKFNQLLEKVNNKATVNLIQVGDIGPGLAVALKEKVERGEAIVIVGDRTSISIGGRVIYAPFLGKKAPFAQGPFILAALLECPIYWIFCFKSKGRFKLIFEHVTDKLALPRKQRAQVLQEIVEKYAQRLSHYAVKYPYQWFNFYDFWQTDEQVSRIESNGENK